MANRKQSRLTDTPKVGRKDRNDGAVRDEAEASKKSKNQSWSPQDKGQGERATARVTVEVAAMGPVPRDE